MYCLCPKFSQGYFLFYRKFGLRIEVTAGATYEKNTFNPLPPSNAVRKKMF